MQFFFRKLTVLKQVMAMMLGSAFIEVSGLQPIRKWYPSKHHLGEMFHSYK